MKSFSEAETSKSKEQTSLDEYLCFGSDVNQYLTPEPKWGLNERKTTKYDQQKIEHSSGKLVSSALCQMQSEISLTSFQPTHKEINVDSSSGKIIDDFFDRMIAHFFGLYVDAIYPYYRNAEINNEDFSFQHFVNTILTFGGQYVLQNVFSEIQKHPKFCGKNIIRWMVFSLYNTSFQKISSIAPNFVSNLLFYNDVKTQEMVIDCLSLWRKFTSIDFIVEYKIRNSFLQKRVSLLLQDK